jgi:MoaA/NifB/PqqE/SkfB family radical SAM enzyme
MPLMRRRVVHIHPTLLCNLACAHCYSTSGPAAVAELSFSDILCTTVGLRAHGYDLASISGGEPTVYGGLEPLCAGLGNQGYTLSIISNGMLPSRVGYVAKEIRPALLSISFDGLEVRHDAIRRRKGSFARAIESVRASVAAGQRTGAVVSVSDEGLSDVPDITDMLVSEGVSHIQLHPLSKVGRARDTVSLAEPDSDTLLRVIVLARVLSALYETVTVECDALPGRDFAERELPCAGDVVSPLVIGADGWVWPVAYGFPARFRFGRIGGDLPQPVYGEELARLIEETAADCATRSAAAFYPDLVRRAEAKQVVRTPG